MKEIKCQKCGKKKILVEDSYYPIIDKDMGLINPELCETCWNDILLEGTNV